ncbi:hypothetical protein ACS0TY_001835 [Phlomoides rotata]
MSSYLQKCVIIPQAEEIKINAAAAESNRNSSDVKTDQTNVIGILGGYTCLNFAKKLYQERSSFPSLSGKPEMENTDHSSIVENLRRKRAFLEESGECCIVMPCHMSHY